MTSSESGCCPDQAVDFLHRLAARAQLHGTELDAFLKDVGRIFRERTDDAPAHVEPVHDDDEERDQGVPIGREHRRVHHHIVKVLPDGPAIVGDDDIALVELLLAVDRESVADGRAEHIGNEERHAAGALRQQPAVRIDDANRIVLVLIDDRAVSRAGNVGVDLIRDRNQPPPDHLDSDRLGTHVSAARQGTPVDHLEQSILISPRWPMMNVSYGPMIVVEPYSSITAGPAPENPTGRL
jgi:hypothetical protein